MTDFYGTTAWSAFLAISLCVWAFVFVLGAVAVLSGRLIPSMAYRVLCELVRIKFKMEKGSPRWSRRIPLYRLLSLPRHKVSETRITKAIEVLEREPSGAFARYATSEAVGDCIKAAVVHAEPKARSKLLRRLLVEVHRAILRGQTPASPPAAEPPKEPAAKAPDEKSTPKKKTSAKTSAKKKTTKKKASTKKSTPKKKTSTKTSAKKTTTKKKTNRKKGSK